HAIFWVHDEAEDEKPSRARATSEVPGLEGFGRRRPARPVSHVLCANQRSVKSSSPIPPEASFEPAPGSSLRPESSPKKPVIVGFLTAITIDTMEHRAEELESHGYTHPYARASRRSTWMAASSEPLVARDAIGP